MEKIYAFQLGKISQIELLEQLPHWQMQLFIQYVVLVIVPLRYIVICPAPDINFFTSLTGTIKNVKRHLQNVP